MGTWYALRNEAFLDTFERYVPFGGNVVDFFEERAHAEKMKSKEAFYHAQASVEPYISRKHLAANDENSAGRHDPLAPHRFFDPGSGQVGLDQREYLPLVSLPETRDPLVTEASMALNDLISGVNASAVYTKSISDCAKRLRDIAAASPTLKAELLAQADTMDQVVKRAGATPGAVTDRAVHVELAQAIVASEHLLVSHINSQGLGDSRLTSTSSATKPKKNTSWSMDQLIEVQVTLSLLIRALDRHNPIDGYVRAIRKELAHVRGDKEALVLEALNGISVPKDVDLQPVLRDILRSL